MAALDQEQVRALDQIRTRLMTLRSSLARLSENLAVQQPLPPASTLQIHANVISSSLQTIAEQLAEHQKLLAATHVFPLPQYPGRPYGGILTDTLLRTKLEPQVEEWIAQGEKFAEQEPGTHMLSVSDRDELWRWAPGAANKEARKQKWGADYTLAEVQGGVEHVKTGLTRDLNIPPDNEEDEEEDDEDGDDFGEVTDEEEEGDKMDVEDLTQTSSNGTGASDGPTPAIAGKPMYLSTLQEFMSTGRIERYEPKLVELRKEAEKKKQGNVAL